MIKKIAIVVLNWNGWRDTLDCLESITRLRDYEITKLEIVVIDNGSTDESVKKLTAYGLRLTAKDFTFRLIKNRENLGFSEGNNVGIRYALEKGADYVVLLNNDTFVSENLIKNLLAVMEKDKNIGVLGPKIYFAPGREFHTNRYKKSERGKVVWYAGGLIDWQNVYCSHRGVDVVDQGQYNKQEETDFVSGCCMMVREEVFEKIGLLDKRYYLYLEDVDFCLRAKRGGFKIIYTPQATLWHKNAESSGKPGSPLHVYYQTRNRLLFGLKYASLRIKLALLRESLRVLKNNGIKRKAVLDFYRAKLGKADFL